MGLTKILKNLCSVRGKCESSSSRMYCSDVSPSTSVSVDFCFAIKPSKYRIYLKRGLDHRTYIRVVMKYENNNTFQR